MSFRYYITNLIDGTVEGTDDTQSAENLATCEDFFVVDSNTGEWVIRGDRSTIEARKELSGALENRNN